MLDISFWTNLLAFKNGILKSKTIPDLFLYLPIRKHKNMAPIFVLHTGKFHINNVVSKVIAVQYSLLCILFYILYSTQSFAQYPTVNTERPRIWMEESRLEELQELISIPGEAQDTYEEVLYAYNNWWITDPELYLAGSDSTLWTWDWSSPYAATESLLTVFFFKMNYDPLVLKRCRFIARNVISHINNINFNDMEWYEKETLLRQLSDNDMLLDQCYDFFPILLRDSLTRSLYIMNREFMNTYILSDYGNSYVSSHNTWNHIYGNQNALTLYHAEALSSSEQDTVNQWYQAIYNKHINEFIPCWTHYRDDDGGWNWGAAYATWSLVDQFQLFENMRIGTTKNFYDDLPWIQNSINQYIYFGLPNNKCIHLGDGQTQFAADRVMYLHANYYNDSRSMWLVQFYSQEQFLTWTNAKFQKLLYKNFNMPEVDHHEMPLDWWTDKVGLSVSRSSWDSTSTMVTFFSSPSKKAAHEHRDNNSFSIFKYAPLIIDAGYYDSYGSEHYKNYYQRSIAHNTICVFDTNETYTYYGEEVANDGGQIESYSLMNYDDIFLSENQRGEWIQFASGDQYQLSIADAQLSYNPLKLDFFRRRLLFLKPDKVIVLDHLHIPNSTTEQRAVKWISHFAHKPDMTGSIIDTQVPNHIETFDGNIYSAINKNGKATIKTLLPHNSKTTRIGGENYEYWVNGINYPPLNDPDTSFFTPGNWRIEVEPTTISDTIIFLHTIEIGEAVSSPDFNAYATQNQFSITADWNDTVYLFSADGSLDKVYHLIENLEGNRNVGLFAIDLEYGSYYIKVDGNIVGQSNTDEHGILQYLVELQAGNHQVEIIKYTLNNQELVKNKAFTISPNPSGSNLTIELPSFESSFEVYIYNLNGKLILQTSNEKRIDVSNLSAGIYHIQLFQANKSHFARFLKK